MQRKEFLTTMLATTGAAMFNPALDVQAGPTSGEAGLMPAFFIGHGNPMYAIQSNKYTTAWSAIGRDTPSPKAILVVSAHWYVPGTGVTLNAVPRTIHDFGGFPRELHEVEYPAPGAPTLAKHVQKLLSPVPVKLDETWGLDHGTWAVLKHIYPNADIPVVQLAIDRNQPGMFHLEIGRRLAPLRHEGVLIVGSGNLVHNLREYAWGQQNPEPFDWAMRFEAQAKELIQAHDIKPLVEYEKLGRDARLSIPTPDHYWPLLYVLGTQQPGEKVTFPIEGIDGGAISMLATRIGSSL
jgi:4,5-DOPA dioxygenase extradiol